MTEDIKLKLARRIRELREKHNYTQQRLAELTNIDYKHIQLLESKQPSAARIDTIEKLAKAFKMTCAEFLNFD
jgi:transcriptional regulator with XRE-family HTH domain